MPPVGSGSSRRPGAGNSLNGSPPRSLSPRLGHTPHQDPVVPRDGLLLVPPLQGPLAAHLPELRLSWQQLCVGFQATRGHPLFLLSCHPVWQSPLFRAWREVRGVSPQWRWGTPKLRDEETPCTRPERKRGCGSYNATRVTEEELVLDLDAVTPLSSPCHLHPDLQVRPGEAPRPLRTAPGPSLLVPPLTSITPHPLRPGTRRSSRRAPAPTAQGIPALPVGCNPTHGDKGGLCGPSWLSAARGQAATWWLPAALTLGHGRGLAVSKQTVVTKGPRALCTLVASGILPSSVGRGLRAGAKRGQEKDGARGTGRQPWQTG